MPNRCGTCASCGQLIGGARACSASNWRSMLSSFAAPALVRIGRCRMLGLALPNMSPELRLATVATVTECQRQLTDRPVPNGSPKPELLA